MGMRDFQGDAVTFDGVKGAVDIRVGAFHQPGFDAVLSKSGFEPEARRLGFGFGGVGWGGRHGGRKDFVFIRKREPFGKRNGGVIARREMAEIGKTNARYQSSMRIALSLLTACMVMAADAADDASKRPPNVVLIMADDVSWECFSSYGGEDYETPNLDALAEHGVQFNHCYSTPICTPSRVEIMTGKYSFRNYTHFGYLDPKEKTFGQLMQAAGYKTAIAGKWQLNGLYHGAEGSDDSSRPHKAGFDEYCLWQVTMGKGGKDGGERFWSPPLEQNGKLLSKQANLGKYGPDIMSDFICDFIMRHRDEPFFIYYPTVLVHDPFVPTPDSIGSAPRTHEANLAPKGATAQKRNFVAMVNYLDKVVGKIVAQIEEVGQLENTIILFTSDNGTNRKITSLWNGTSISGGKGGTTDMGTHVPFIASWKGRTTPGTKLDDLIDFTDFFPTLAEVAGVPIRPQDAIDGRSFLPQLMGKKGSPREWVFCHYQPYWGNFMGNQFVRDENYKLYRDGRFFHVPADLIEKENLKLGAADELGEAARQALGKVMLLAPPAPPREGGPKAETRPIDPQWKLMTNPDD